MRRGERRPETFAFLGFTHYYGRTRDDRFIVKHKMRGRRLTRKLATLRPEARPLMHRSLAEQHRWHVSVLSGYYACFGVPHNWRAPNGFLREVRRIWLNCLRRRSQKTLRTSWSWFGSDLRGQHFEERQRELIEPNAAPARFAILSLPTPGQDRRSGRLGLLVRSTGGRFLRRSNRDRRPRRPR